MSSDEYEQAKTKALSPPAGKAPTEATASTPGSDGWTENHDAGYRLALKHVADGTVPYPAQAAVNAVSNVAGALANGPVASPPNTQKPPVINEVKSAYDASTQPGGANNPFDSGFFKSGSGSAPVGGSTAAPTSTDFFGRDRSTAASTGTALVNANLAAKAPLVDDAARVGTLNPRTGNPITAAVSRYDWKNQPGGANNPFDNGFFKSAADTPTFANALGQRLSTTSTGAGLVAANTTAKASLVDDAAPTGTLNLRTGNPVTAAVSRYDWNTQPGGARNAFSNGFFKGDPNVAGVAAAPVGSTAAVGNPRVGVNGTTRPAVQPVAAIPLPQKTPSRSLSLAGSGPDVGPVRKSPPLWDENGNMLDAFGQPIKKKTFPVRPRNQRAVRSSFFDH